MGAEVAVGALIVGTALNVYGQQKAAEAQAGAARADAANKAALAQEVMDRANVNAETMMREGRNMAGNQASQYAAGNVDVGSGTPLLAMENTLAETRRKINNMETEARFRAQQYLISGAAEKDLADQTMQAGYFRMAGSLISTGGAAYKYASGLGEGDDSSEESLLTGKSSEYSGGGSYGGMGARS